MSGHYATVEWDGYDGPTYTFTCDEPPEALCRAQWDCDCERYASCGIDDQGPWHELADGYMTVAELQAVLKGTAERPRHYGFPSNECGQLLFITSSGEEGYMGGGSVRFPIDLDWSADDESYLWSAQ